MVMHQSTNGSASISSQRVLNNELFSFFLLDADIFLSLASYKYLLHELLLYIGYTKPQTTVIYVQKQYSCVKMLILLYLTIIGREVERQHI